MMAAMVGRSPAAAIALIIFFLGISSCKGGDDLREVRLWALAPPEVVPADGDGQVAIRFAVALTISPQRGYPLYKDLAEALGQKIGRPVRLILRRIPSEVGDLVRSQQAEVAQLCSWGFLQGRADFGLTALAVPEVRGRTSHPSYVIVSAESEIGSPGELQGKSFAFADPLCASEPFPAGRRPEAFFRRRVVITSHDRAIRAVAEGLVDAALVDGRVYAWLALSDSALIAKTKVIEETAPIMHPPIVVHPGLDPALREDLRRAFLSLHEESTGRLALARLGIDRFVAPAGEVGGGGR